MDRNHRFTRFAPFPRASFVACRRLLALALVLFLPAACERSPAGPDALAPPDPLLAEVPPSEALHITPTGLEFGEVQVGTTSPPQTVWVTNVSGAPLTLSGAGPAPGEPFDAVEGCEGVTLAPGTSCPMTFSFSPEEGAVQTATSAGAWNEQAFSIELGGTGVLPRLLVTPAALEFGEVPLGSTSAAQTVTVANVGTSPVTMSGLGGVPGTGFDRTQNCEGMTLAPGATCQMSFTFAPSALGPALATSAGAWNDVAFSIQLRGTGIEAGASPSAALRITPTALQFGEVQVGTASSPQVVSVTNVSDAALILTGTGGAPGGSFQRVQGCEDVTLAPGGSCQMSFTFEPTGLAVESSVSVDTWNGQSFLIALHGTGVLPRLLVTPTGLDFGEVPVGTTSAQQEVTVTNTGSATVLMSGVGGAPGGAFTRSEDCQGVALAPGASCQMLFAFAPVAVGASGATASGAWNDVPFALTLAGRGIGEGPPVGEEGDADQATFLPPLDKQPRVRAGSNLVVQFTLSDENGRRLPAVEAEALGAACAVRVSFAGTDPEPNCARYLKGAGRFQFLLRVQRDLAPGSYELVVRLENVGGAQVVGQAEVVVF